MLHLISGLARPIGAPIGAQLYKHGGYICVFATSLGGIILGAFYLIFRIQKYKWTPSKDAVRVNFFKKYQNIFPAFATCLILTLLWNNFSVWTCPANFQEG